MTIQRLFHCLLIDPEPAAVLSELHGADLFQGLVVDITDGGDSGRYAVVEVEGLK